MTNHETPLVLRSDEGPVRTLTLNRGERFNPLSSAMIAALQAELDGLAADESSLIWHTQGSGKPLTMVFAGQKLRARKTALGASGVHTAELSATV